MQVMIYVHHQFGKSSLGHRIAKKLGDGELVSPTEDVSAGAQSFEALVAPALERLQQLLCAGYTFMYRSFPDLTCHVWIGNNVIQLDANGRAVTGSQVCMTPVLLPDAG